ncbi:acyl-CoA dehydrogenase family protein [Catenuloplanes indicus]|uniref:Acyl-CoA dehydrogenase n=1 Tax=Catenuloplanes indicus TaxID=137267 RepID=A0AAE3W680_9ACTN|nr:acyl-CoA dehydrogenase family protein [Catenuloplanes indicus]MDQ0370663.1 hypothetical protein [Catenuloplanes indicus]
MTPTHEVTNQPPPLHGYDVSADPVLEEALDREGAGWSLPDLRALGRRAGAAEAQRWGVEANEFPPVLRTHDRYGHRIDEVGFHPSWHRLMETGVAAGLAGAPWASPRPGAHVARAAAMSVWSTVESGHTLPRVLPDGTRNTFRIQRLKDKLGNRSNASAEPEFDDTVAWPVGEPGRGVRTILEMVSLTRLDCAVGSAAGIRAALVQAVHHARWRHAFGRPLLDAPLMRNVLADLALESEAATALAFRVAGAVDRGERDFARVATALAKFWICKRHPVAVAEALECLGGNGYVEESGLPRLYRDAPLNGIWEGSGNVNALDVLRALSRSPSALDAYAAEVSLAAGADRRLDAAWTAVRAELAAATEFGARRLVERMALVLQAALLVRHAPPAVADAFCASRLDRDRGLAFGTLPAAADVTGILARVPPVPAGG